jgi:hypothetical protein
VRRLAGKFTSEDARPGRGPDAQPHPAAPDLQHRHDEPLQFLQGLRHVFGLGEVVRQFIDLINAPPPPRG